MVIIGANENSIALRSARGKCNFPFNQIQPVSGKLFYLIINYFDTWMAMGGLRN